MTTTIKKQILIDARALFTHPDTWIKGKIRNETNTAWCLEGAIVEAGARLGLTDQEAKFPGAFEQLARTIAGRCQISYRYDTIPRYNDSPETTFENVQELLDDAIDLCDAQLSPTRKEVIMSV